MKNTTLINEFQSLKSAKCGNHSIATYDDGYGPLFIHRDSIRINGIVRAKTWVDAYSIFEDEFFQEADETIDEIIAEYNVKRDHVKIIKTASGEQRAAISSDYPFNETGCFFVKWETIETPTDEDGAFMENELFQEAFGIRPNGPNATDVLKHGIYSKDLNGDRLELLTPELLELLEITLEIESNE